MLGVRLRITGANLPACLAQDSTVLSVTQDVLASDTHALAFYDDGQGGAVTQTLLLVFSGAVPGDGETIYVRTSTGGQTLTRELVVRDALAAP